MLSKITNSQLTCLGKHVTDWTPRRFITAPFIKLTFNSFCTPGGQLPLQPQHLPHRPAERLQVRPELVQRDRHSAVVFNGAPLRLHRGGQSDVTLQRRAQEPVTNFLNQSILNDTKRLYQIEKTFDGLSKKSLKDPAFEVLADVLDHSEFISSLLHLLKSVYYQGGHTRDGLRQADERILKIVELVFRGLDQKTFREALDFGILTTSSGPFRSFVSHLGVPLVGLETQADRDVKNLALLDRVLKYLGESHTFKCGSRNETLLSEFRSLVEGHQVFPMLDLLLGQDQSEIEKKLPDVNRLLKGLVAKTTSGDLLLDQVARSFRSLSVPIACMQGAKTIPDGTRYFIRELAEFRAPEEAARYLSYEAPLTLMSLGQFCSFPRGLNDHYKALHELVDSGVTEPLLRVLKVLYHADAYDPASSPSHKSVCELASGYQGELQRPWIDLMVHFLADGGRDGQGGLHLLTPVLAEFVSRGWVGDALLLSTVYGSQERESLNSVLAWVLESRPELNHQSVVEVASEALLRGEREQIYRFLQHLTSLLLEKDGQWMRDLLETARKIHYVNDATPFLDLMRQFGSEATSLSSQKLFETLFFLLENHEKELLFTLDEWATLARNGELKGLVDSLLQLFHQYASTGKTEIFEIAEPRFARVGRHSLRAVESGEFRAPDENPGRAERYSERYAACRKLDLEFSLGAADAPQGVNQQVVKEQLEQLLSCKKSGAETAAQPAEAPEFNEANRQPNAEVDRLFASLNAPTLAGDSFLSFQLGEFQKLLSSFKSSEIKYLVDQWMGSFQFTGGLAVDSQAERELLQQNPWVRALNAVPAWVTSAEPVHPAPGVALVKAVGPVLEKPETRRALENVEHVGADILKNDDFPKLLMDAEGLWSRVKQIHDQQNDPQFREHELAKQQAALAAIYTPELREVLKYWVSAVECWRSPLNISQRVEEIIHESRTRLTNYELKHERWDLAALKEKVTPIFDRLRDKSQSDEKRPLLDATLNVLKSATGPQESKDAEGSPFKHYQRDGDRAWVRYSPERLLRLLHKRARRVRPRIQYYKGDSHPYVVLDSDLDQLEKSLYNVDMRLDVPPWKNIAYQFAQEIAHAWGDLPAQEWPEDIVRQHQQAYDLAASQHFTDPVSWEHAAQAAYQSLRPRTLKEVVDGIASRPPSPGFEFNPVTVGPQILAFQAGWPLPEGKKNFSRDYGMEDLRLLTSKIAGLPPFPQCVADHQNFFRSDEFELEMTRVVHLPLRLDKPDYRQPPVPKEASGHPILKDGLKLLKGGGEKGARELADMQGMLFNLWQVIGVLKENVPGGPDQDDGGLLPIMRDLFYEVFYSNTPEVKSQHLPSTDLKRNNLGVVSHMLQLGLMHQIGLILQNFELDDPDLTASFVSLIRGAATPEMRELTDWLLKRGAQDQQLHHQEKDQLIWTVIQGLSSAQSNQVSELHRIIFYLLASVNRLEPWEGALRKDSTSGIPNLALARGHEILDGFYPWFVSLGVQGDFSSLLHQVLDSKWASSGIEAFYQATASSPQGFDRAEESERPLRWGRLLTRSLGGKAIDFDRSPAFDAVHLVQATWEDREARKSWGQFVQGVERLQSQEDYQKLNLLEVVRPVLDFLEEKNGGQGPEVARAMRQNVAQFISFKKERGDRSNGLNEFLLYARKNPEEFDQLLKLLSETIQKGDWVDFLKVIRRSLPQ